MKFYRDLLNCGSLHHFVKYENKVSYSIQCIKKCFRSSVQFLCKLNKAFPILFVSMKNELLIAV